MRKSVLAPALIVGMLSGAHAFGAQQSEPHKWYVLSFQDGECHLAATVPDLGAANPEQYHNYLRNIGITDQIHVQKDGDGNVSGVVIIFKPPGSAVVGLWWFPSSDLCETGKTAAKSNGLLPDTKDLK